MLLLMAADGLSDGCRICCTSSATTRIWQRRRGWPAGVTSRLASTLGMYLGPLARAPVRPCVTAR